MTTPSAATAAAPSALATGAAKMSRRGFSARNTVERRASSGAGGQSVIHENHVAVAYRGRRTRAAEECEAALRLRNFARGDLLDVLLAHVQRVHELVIDHSSAIRGNSTNGELLPARRTKLASNEHVQLRAQQQRDRRGHRNPAARDREHGNRFGAQLRDRIEQLAGKKVSRLRTIAEEHAVIWAAVGGSASTSRS